jgi:hypothetical protein
VACGIAIDVLVTVDAVVAVGMLVTAFAGLATARPDPAIVPATSRAAASFLLSLIVSLRDENR